MSERVRCKECGHVVDEPLAPSSRVPATNIAARPVTELNVVEWHDTPQPTGRPSAVALLIHVEGEDVPVVVRMKTAAFVNELVRALDRHRAGVWPSSKGAVRG